MAILQALIALLGRSAGKILNAAFGWAVRALFGSVSGKEKTLLTVLVALAALWPVLLLGIAFPKVSVFVLTFVPLPESVSERVIRLVWLGLAVAVPLVLGFALGARGSNDAEESNDSEESSDSEESKESEKSAAGRVLQGFPVTLGIAVAFWITLVCVPVLRVADFFRGRRDAHVPLMTTSHGYFEAARRIRDTLNARGFDLVPREPRWWVRTSMRVLRALGGGSMRRYVPEKLAHFAGSKLEVTLHPSSLLLRGAVGPTTIAHGLVAEALTRSDTLQSSDPKAQEIEREIQRIWESIAERPGSPERSSGLDPRLRAIADRIVALETSYDDWETVYRQALQLGRALDGHPQLLARAEDVAIERTGEASPDRPRIAS